MKIVGFDNKYFGVKYFKDFQGNFLQNVQLSRNCNKWCLLVLNGIDQVVQ